jgi:secreted Zn-dependent insulinase-like peptidase
VRGGFQQASRHFDELESGTRQWDRADRDVAALRLVDKAKLVAFYRRYVAPSSSERRALALHVSASMRPSEAPTSVYIPLSRSARFFDAMPNIPLRDPEINQ